MEEQEACTSPKCHHPSDNEINNKKGSGKGRHLPLGDKAASTILSFFAPRVIKVPGFRDKAADVNSEDARSVSVEKPVTKHVEECQSEETIEDFHVDIKEEVEDDESETSPLKRHNTTYSGTHTVHVPNTSSHWRGIVRFWRQRSSKRFTSIPPGVLKKLYKNNKENRGSGNKTIEPEFCFLKPSWKNFTLEELQNATNHFSVGNIIGKGGYAEVYKGCLEDGQLVAIKRLTKGTAEDVTSDFLSELGIIVHINHPNAARLIGFGVEGGLFLVLQLSHHGSLESLLHGSKERKLEWSIRYKIAIGTAEGLEYLHEGCQKRIIHRDIKTANILLTEEFEPQICDFGLAMWLPGQHGHHTVSNFEGTFGYMAPEYLLHGIVDEKIDVFAFGVVLLELITGRKAIDSSQHSLVMWAKPLLDKNDLPKLVDPSLASYDTEQMNYLIVTASLCIRQSSVLRPSMGQVVYLLKGEGNLESMGLSQRPILQRTYSEELFDAEEYNSTRYLGDLDRYMELVLGI